MFIKGSPEARERGRKGGKTGKKNFAVMPKEQLKQLSVEAGKRSGVVRREKKKRSL